MIYNATVSWSPDFSNLYMDEVTGLVVTADFTGNYPSTFAEIPERFSEGAKVTNPISGKIFTNIGTVSVPNFMSIENIIGPTGPTGPIGPTGPTGPTI
jgi:hypothetical protein